MPNAAVLAARLAGRPILMRDVEAAMYARQLLTFAPGQGGAGGGGSPFAAFMSRARRALHLQADASPDLSDGASLTGPQCYYPMWLDQAEGEPEAEGFGWTLKGGVALVDISGPLLDQGFVCGWSGEVWINGYDTLAATFAEACADPRVQAVFVRHDSPGGIASSGLPALAAQLRAARAEAGGKPIWSWCEMAASADYWLASSTDRVSAPRLGMVGSIGAVVTLCNMTGALEKDGFSVEHIQFGAKKTDGSPYKPLSAAARADLQAEIDELGGLFVADVVAGRPNLTEKTVLGTEAGCFLGDHTDKARSGFALGLTDAVQSEAEAFAELRALIGTTPHRSPAASAAPAAVKETDMNRSQVLAAARAAKLSAADLAKLEAELPADDTQEGDEGEDTVEAGASDDGNDTVEGGGADAEDEGDAPDAKTSQAILDSPHAKGRETLARKLAFTSGMTLKTAEGLLQSAPKGSALAARLGETQRLGADTPEQSKKPFASATDIYAKAREAGLKNKPGR